MSVVPALFHEHNRPEAAWQDYQLAVLEHEASAYLFDHTNPKTVARLHRAIRRRWEAWERYELAEELRRRQP